MNASHSMLETPHDCIICKGCCTTLEKSRLDRGDPCSRGESHQPPTSMGLIHAGRVNAITLGEASKSRHATRSNHSRDILLRTESLSRKHGTNRCGSSPWWCHSRRKRTILTQKWKHKSRQSKSLDCSRACSAVDRTCHHQQQRRSPNSPPPR